MSERVDLDALDERIDNIQGYWGLRDDLHDALDELRASRKVVEATKELLAVFGPLTPPQRTKISTIPQAVKLYDALSALEEPVKPRIQSWKPMSPRGRTHSLSDDDDPEEPVKP